MNDTSSPKDVQLAAQMRAPSGASGNTAPMLIASTGATPLANGTALEVGAFASLIVGDAKVRIAFGTTAAAAIAACTTTSPLLQPGARIDWEVTERDQFVACREGVAAAGASEAWVWTSSGPRSTS